MLNPGILKNIFIFKILDAGIEIRTVASNNRFSPEVKLQASSYYRGALLMGFRTSAGILEWVAVFGILSIFTLALTWIAVIAGLCTD